MANQNITKKSKSFNENTIFRYLCPSLLSENEILEEIKTRCSNIKGLEKKSRDELTQIFIRHLMPLPQRTFPDNHHGKLITQMILKENLLSRRNSKLEDSRSSSLQYGFRNSKQDANSSSLHNSTKLISRDRLKPPIDPSEIKCTKISLTKTQCSSSDSTEQESSRNQRDLSAIKSHDETVKTKKMDLKRSHSPSEKTEETSPSKKARQKIAWP